jgi:hypothetical protein
MAIDAELGMLVTEIDANLSHAETITHGLTNAQFNWRPEAGRWSIAECVSHLVIVDRGDIAPLRAAIEKGRAQNQTGEGPYEYGFLARKFVSSMDLPVKKKFKAPKYYAPPPESELEKTMAEYRRTAGEIRALAISANGLHLGKLKSELPQLPGVLRAIIKMPLGARLALMVAHDRRHLWQAEQVRQDARFPQE